MKNNYIFMLVFLTCSLHAQIAFADSGLTFPPGPVLGLPRHQPEILSGVGLTSDERMNDFLTGDSVATHKKGTASAHGDAAPPPGAMSAEINSRDDNVYNEYTSELGKLPYSQEADKGRKDKRALSALSVIAPSKELEMYKIKVLESDDMASNGDGAVAVPDVSRSIYDYRTGNLPALLKKKRFNSENSHLPPVLYTDEYSVQMFKAIQEDDVGAIRALLDRGARLDALANNKYTPLLYAIMYDSKDAFSYLLRAGADPNFVLKDGYTIAHILARKKDIYALEQLFESGADETIKDKSGKTVFDYLSDKESSLLVEKIIQDCPSLEQCAFKYVNMSSYSLFSEIMKAGANPDAVDADNNTLLMHAIASNDIDKATLLLLLGAQTGKSNTVGKTPLQLAREMNNKQMLDILKTVIVNRDLKKSVNSAAYPLPWAK